MLTKSHHSAGGPSQAGPVSEEEGSTRALVDPFRGKGALRLVGLIDNKMRYDL